MLPGIYDTVQFVTALSFTALLIPTRGEGSFGGQACVNGALALSPQSEHQHSTLHHLASDCTVY